MTAAFPNLFNDGGAVVLDHVRVTGGERAIGGRLGNRDGAMTVRQSLIDGNAASQGAGIANVAKLGPRSTLARVGSSSPRCRHAAAHRRRRCSTPASAGSASPQGYTGLKLIEKLAPCAKRATAGTAAEKPKTRKLWGPDFRLL